MRLRNNDGTREEILTRYFPQYRLIAPQAHSGLGGASCIIEQGERRLVLRQNHDPSAPASHFRRQFRALRRLPADLVPAPRFFRQGWMAVDYLNGDVKSALPDTPELATMLYHLHRQPRLPRRSLGAHGTADRSANAVRALPASCSRWYAGHERQHSAARDQLFACLSGTFTGAPGLMPRLSPADPQP